MAILKKQDNEFLVYEESELVLLVAIRKDEQKKIKTYWKSKDKSKVADTTVSGHPFIQKEDQDGLSIDFSQEGVYDIVNLKKFD